MASIFKSLSPSDYSIVPFEAYYKFSYEYHSGSTNNSSDVSVAYGEKFPRNPTEIRTANNTYELFDSVVQTFYSPAPYTSYGITNASFIPDTEVYVIGVTQNAYGEKVLPGSFSIQVGTSQSYDDGKGNLIVSSSGTGSIIGRIFYDKGITVIKPAGYVNLNPDPTWENEEGGNVSPTGWQHLIDRKLTSDLTTKDGVYQGFPRQDIHAAKISSRTSLYISAYSFYNIPVTAGNKYRISGWVYANGTTWRGIQNGGVEGSDYPIGYFIQFLDSGDNIIQEKTITTELGPIGWKFLLEELSAPTNVVSLRVGPFIDGPYPAGYMYGDPVCSDEDALRGCPGYAWFAGLKVEQTNPAQNLLSGDGLINQGLRIVSGTYVDINFSSSVTLYENIFRAKIQPNDFLHAFNNPSVYSSISGSTSKPKDLMVSGTLEPYVTTIGFYNDNNELLVVGKPSVPIKRTRDLTQTFIVKFDV
jgi:hypothetical protein